MTLALVILVVGGIGAPHVLDLRRARPVIAASLWGSALALRAATVLGLAAWALLRLPDSKLFHAVLHWCWRPPLPASVGLDGHALGLLAVGIVSGGLVGGVVLSGVRALDVVRRVRRLVREHHVGTGPRASVILAEQEVFLAAAGVTRPRVLVSVGTWSRSTTRSLRPRSRTRKVTSRGATATS
jgi:hypothetical protein